MKHQQSASPAATHHPVRARRPAPTQKSHDGAAVVPDANERDAFVRETAYTFYEARGRVDGYDLDDWLRAEAQAVEAFGERAGAAARLSSEP
ncbi:MAG: DUF2934 domain-containing protein [Pseudomonadota bacterium]